MSLKKDFYEELVDVIEDSLVKGKYIIYERDLKRGYRIIHFDSNSETIYREEKFP